MSIQTVCGHSCCISFAFTLACVLLVYGVKFLRKWIEGKWKNDVMHQSKEKTECYRGEKGRFSLFSFVKCWSFARSHQQLAICHTFLVKQELHSSFLRCWLILQILTPTQCALILMRPKDPCSVFYQSGDLPRRTLVTLYGRFSSKPFSFLS